LIKIFGRKRRLDKKDELVAYPIYFEGWFGDFDVGWSKCWMKIDFDRLDIC